MVDYVICFDAVQRLERAEQEGDDSTATAGADIHAAIAGLTLAQVHSSLDEMTH